MSLEKKFSSVQAQNQKVEGLRGSLIAIEKAMGKSITEIARKYGTTPGSVKKYLSSEEAEAFVEHYRVLAYENLASKALAVYEAQLDLGNLDAARDIAHGLGILQKDGGGGKNQKIQVIETLDAYRKERESAAVGQRPRGTPVLHLEGGGDEAGDVHSADS